MAEEKFLGIGLRLIILILLNFVFFGGGIFLAEQIGTIYNISLVEYALLVLAVFVFSLPFFGYLSPLIFAGTGYLLGLQILKEPLLGLTLVPLIFSSTGGLILAQNLLSNIKKNEPVEKKRISIIFLVLAFLMVLGIKWFLVSQGKATLLN